MRMTHTMAMTVCLCLVLVSLVFGVDYHDEPPECKAIRMSPKFPCDVTECGSEVTFDCSDRGLKELPEELFPNATVLNLTENYFANFLHDAFSKLKNLKVLNLDRANRGNKVNFTGKELKDLSKLQDLKLSGIGLHVIPKNLPVSLKSIALSYNHIVNLNQGELSGMEEVRKLWISKNCFSDNPCNIDFTITSDAFVKMTKLKHLDLSFNNITKVPKNLPASLLKLNLETNSIAYISKKDFRGLNNLTHLMIQGNCPRCQNAPFPCVPCKNISLSIHKHAFRDLRKLHTLNLGGNSLKYLKSFWFKHMPELRCLLLAFNFLMNTITGEAKWLRSLQKLTLLDLSFNFALKSYPQTLHLSSNFSKLKSLETLHLEGVVFQTIDKRTLEPLYQLKKLSALNLGTNFIYQIASDIFNKFPPLKMILLSENRLYPVSVINAQHPNNVYKMAQNISLSPLTRTYPDYKMHRHIKQECFDAGQVLILSRNNLFFITEKQFIGYENIACLNLSQNGFSAALNGTEFSSLPNLTYLDLSFNKIDLAYDNAFKELQKLEVLDLSYNSHYFQAFGVTHNLNFTVNLHVLRVLNMSFNSINMLTTKQMYSKSLSELQFQYNYLGELWKDKSYDNLFTHLTNLSILDISYNSITKIPQQVYETLPRTLTQLRITNNYLSNFEWGKLRVFCKLQILDLSHNLLSELRFSSNDAPALKVLDLSYNKLLHLDNGILKSNSSLKTLYLNNNKLNILNQSTFDSNPVNQLETLYIHNNPLQCTCHSLDFILWIEKSIVKIPKLTTGVKCDTPEKLRSSMLIYFDIHSCANNIVAYNLYIVSSSFIIVFTFVAMVAHLFYWDVFYILYYVKAKLKGYSALSSPQCAYDVFVTYNTKDSCVSDWVMEKLLVKLEEEGEKIHSLCLEERDWVPGTPLLENLTHSIKCSRKTLFVLTEGYVRTGMFKLAMYLAHQRLLDENEDVILVLLLEPVLQHSHFLRLRRRLCGRSVLEWPETAAAEPWFWQNLRNIISEDNEVLYNETYTNYFNSR